MASHRPALAVRLFIFGVVPLPLAVETNLTVELGGPDMKARAFSSLTACDRELESLSMLQIKTQRQSHRDWESQSPVGPIPFTVVRPVEVPSPVAPTAPPTGEVPSPVAPTAPPTAPLTASPTAPPVEFQKILWIKSFPRSGSTLLFSLIQQVDFPIFALFEPCSIHDTLEPWLAEKGCEALLSQLGQCNFTGIKWLFGWNSPYSSINGANTKFDPDSASEACQSADLVAFKTVTWGHDMAMETIPFLEAHPHWKAIDLIRDPRSIYTSMRSTAGFQKMSDVPWLTNMCDSMYDNLNKTHPRMAHLLYEGLVKSPEATARNIFSFMAIPEEVGRHDADQFLKDNFHNEDCDDESGFGICKKNSTEPVERYTQLTEEASAAFMSRMSCRAVADHYGFSY